MSYKKVGWEDSPSSNTPILSVSLNQMDDGIEKANKGIVFSYCATFTADNVLKNTRQTDALGAGDFATSQTDITTAYVSNAVTKIGSGTFANCTSLKTIYIDNTVGNVDIVGGAVPDGVSIVYSNDDNFINVNELLASAIKSLKKQANADKSDWENRATSIEAQHKTDVQALTDKANSIVEQANTDRQNFNNSVDEINTKLETKENVSNKVSVITHPSLDYYPDTKAVFDYVNSKLETPLSDIESLKSGKLDKADFNSYKTSNDNAVNSKVDTTDFNAYKTATDKAIADNTKSIKANATAIDKCVTDLSLSSTGYYNLHCNYKTGSIDKATGEEKDGSAFITDKLDLSQYSNVTITTDRPTLYASVFEYDSNNKFTKVIADTKNKITFSPVAKYKYIIWLWYGGTDISKIAKAHIKGKSINTIAENDTRYELARETCKLDLPDAFYIQKGGTLELFKYGMYYSNYEFVDNKYNVRLVNLSGYVTEYSDKIVIKCPTDYTDETLRKPSDLPLFQLLNRFGNVIDSKRVKIYVADVAKVTDKTRRIMYLGDSFTGMAVRSGETANLISQTSLTDTKLIGSSIGQGSGNKFTGTGGYSWANYTDNPNTLPSEYPNNYLWVDSYNNISMKHFVQNTLNETQLDYLVILLGWNDYENGAFANKFNWSDLKMRAKKLIENTHAGFPNCKIILESYHYMYPHKRKSYGNTMPQVRQNKYIYDLNRLYQEIANEYDFVTFVQMSCQVDVIHNMTMESAKVNKRSEKIVEYCKDCVHPANEGFYQYSDAEFTTLTYLMTKETPAVEEGE